MLLVCNLNNTVYICLDHIVSKGIVEIKNDRQKTIHKHRFENSNYEKVNMQDRKGDFVVKVNYESETVTRHIHI